MKRLLLSVCLVGLVFAGHTPNPLPRGGRATQRGAAGVPCSPKFGCSTRSASVFGNEDNLEQGASKKSAPVASVEEIFSPALPQKTEAREDGREDDAMRVVVASPPSPIIIV